MDIKTLEYMEERTKKARVIIEKIEALTKAGEKAVEIRGIQTTNYQSTKLFGITDVRHPELIKALRIEIMNLIAEEIRRLEHELAEI